MTNSFRCSQPSPCLLLLIRRSLRGRHRDLDVSACRAGPIDCDQIIRPADLQQPVQRSFLAGATYDHPSLKRLQFLGVPHSASLVYLTQYGCSAPGWQSPGRQALVHCLLSWPRLEHSLKQVSRSVFVAMAAAASASPLAAAAWACDRLMVPFAAKAKLGDNANSRIHSTRRMTASPFFVSTHNSRVGCLLLRIVRSTGSVFVRSTTSRCRRAIK